MASMLLFSAFLALLVRQCSALPDPVPDPLITPFAFPAFPLMRRQFSSLGTTCGYVNGDFSSQIGCPSTLVCATDSSSNVAGGCCNPSQGCILPTTCIESASLSELCDGQCSSDPATQKCSDSTKAFCYTLSWFYSDDFRPTEISCTSVSGYIGSVELTYTRDGDVVITPTSTSTSTSRISSSSTTPSSTSAATPTPSTPSGSGSSTPVGAIAGGTVGGVVGLALIAALITWLILRHRKKARQNPEISNTTTSAASRPPPGPGYSPGMSSPGMAMAGGGGGGHSPGLGHASMLGGSSSGPGHSPGLSSTGLAPGGGFYAGKEGSTSGGSGSIYPPSHASPISPGSHYQQSVAMPEASEYYGGGAGGAPKPNEQIHEVHGQTVVSELPAH